MKILQLSNKGIYPPDGGTIAITNLSKCFAKKGHQVTLFTIETEKHYNPEKIKEEFKSLGIRLISSKISTKISIFDALINLFFSRLPYNAQRFYQDEVKSKIINILEQDSYNIIQIEGLYMALYIPFLKQYSSAKICFRAHNIEEKIWERNANETSFLKRIYFRIIAKRLKKLERDMMQYYDAIIPITQTDSQYYYQLKTQIKIHTAPFGINFDSIQRDTTTSSKLSLFYIGALDWIPNINGLKWFIKEVWPLVNKKYPDLDFYIAGRNCNESLIKHFSKYKINYLGEIDDAYKYMNQNGIMIVPLFSGSGMRVKIIEGMFLNKPIIATSIAAEGIDYNDENDILIANNVHEFVNSIERLIENPEEAVTIGNNAHHFVKEKYNNSLITEKLIEFYNTIINES